MEPRVAAGICCSNRGSKGLRKGRVRWAGRHCHRLSGSKLFEPALVEQAHFEGAAGRDGGCGPLPEARDQ